jgi:hypothetical protein
MHFHVCTVATRQNKGLDQLLESCKRHAISIDVLGFGKKFRGFSEKLLLMQDYLKTLPDDDIVLFVDAYDVLFLADQKTILDTFLKMHKPFVISGDKGCFPFRELGDQFPESPTSFRYLNAGGYIGYVGHIRKLIHDLAPFQAEDDDQGLMLKHFLKHPEAYSIDHACKLFLTTATLTEKDILIDKKHGSVTCVETHTKPCIVHGNAWSLWYQYIHDRLFDPEWVDEAEGEEYKTICLTILAKNSAITLPKYLHAMDQLRYKKNLMTIYVNAVSSEDGTKEILKQWCDEHKHEYAKIVFEETYEKEQESSHMPLAQRYIIPKSVRKKSLTFAEQSGCDYLFVVDCDVIIYPYTLKELLSYKKPIIAPMLQSMPDDNFTGNFFHEINPDGSRKNDPDYLKILRRSQKGIFEVPALFGAYLVDARVLPLLSYEDNSLDPQHLILSKEARKHGIPQYVCNQRNFGFMIHFSDFFSIEQSAILRSYFQKAL